MNTIFSNKCILFWTLIILIGLTPLSNWYLTDKVWSGGIWRTSMVIAFVIGYFCNSDTFKKYNKKIDDFRKKQEAILL